MEKNGKVEVFSDSVLLREECGKYDIELDWWIITVEVSILLNCVCACINGKL